MNILGLITARGGSKSIPYKNIAPLAGRPMLAYTCDAAHGSRLITRTILSTDDEKIASVGREYGVEVPFMRPDELAQDTSTSLAVARHAIRWLEENEHWRTDVLVLLQPTSPLREARHIDEALGLLDEGVDTVVSVVEVPHRFSPYNVMEFADGRLTDFWKGELPFDRFRRQNLPRLYARNGPAVLICQAQGLFERDGFYGEHVVPYPMDEASSVDIDTAFDLRLAEWLLESRRKS